MAFYSSRLDVWCDDYGNVFNIHDPKVCAGRYCCIHNPSNHHMKDWPQYYRTDRGIMERICKCGVGHPDPDDINPDKTHGCCGCCRKPK